MPAIAMTAFRITPPLISCPVRSRHDARHPARHSCEIFPIRLTEACAQTRLLDAHHPRMRADGRPRRRDGERDRLRRERDPEEDDDHAREERVPYARIWPGDDE